MHLSTWIHLLDSYNIHESNCVTNVRSFTMSLDTKRQVKTWPLMFIWYVSSCIQLLLLILIAPAVHSFPQNWDPFACFLKLFTLWNNFNKSCTTWGAWPCNFHFLTFLILRVIHNHSMWAEPKMEWSELKICWSRAERWEGIAENNGMGAEHGVGGHRVGTERRSAAQSPPRPNILPTL